MSSTSTHKEQELNFGKCLIEALNCINKVSTKIYLQSIIFIDFLKQFCNYYLYSHQDKSSVIFFSPKVIMKT